MNVKVSDTFDRINGFIIKIEILISIINQGL